jgi:hypothetical protein
METITSDPDVLDAIRDATSAAGNLDWNKLAESGLIDKFEDANGVLDYNKLQDITSDLIKKERLDLISGTGAPVIDKATGEVSKIYEALRDPQVKEKLMDAIRSDGELDFSMIS